MKAGTDAATVTDVQVNHVSQTIAKPYVSGLLPLSGIKEYDYLVSKFQKLEISFLDLCAGLWNEGRKSGISDYLSGNDS
jgi:hypothetical protein